MGVSRGLRVLRVVGRWCAVGRGAWRGDVMGGPSGGVCSLPSVGHYPVPRGVPRGGSPLGPPSRVACAGPWPWGAAGRGATPGGGLPRPAARGATIRAKVALWSNNVAM